MTNDNIVHMTNNINNTEDMFNQLVAETFTVINDEVFATLVSTGVDAGVAHGIAYLDVPLDENILRPDFSIDWSDLDTNHDDVVFASL